MSEQLIGKRVALTGGAGFVGTALVHRLAPHNDVRILDLGVHGQAMTDLDGITVTVGDVRDPDAVAAFLDGAEVIIHLASIAGVSAVLQRPVATMDTILTGARNVLHAVVGCTSVERVIVFSTSEVAGRLAYKVSEDATLNDTRTGELRWTYAAAKLASEFQAAAFQFEHQVPTVCLRPFNIYGPGQLGSGAIREFARRAVEGSPLLVHGDGAQIRAWCYIDDVVDAVELCCAKDASVGQVFNIGNPRSVITTLELAKLVKRLAQSESEVKFVPDRDVEVDLRVPDISRARSLLGFEPKVDLDEGVARTLRVLREGRARL